MICCIATSDTNIQNNVFFFSHSPATTLICLYQTIRFIHFEWFTKENCNHQLLHSLYCYCCRRKKRTKIEQKCYYFISRRLFLLEHGHLRPKQLTYNTHDNVSYITIKWKNEITTCEMNLFCFCLLLRTLVIEHYIVYIHFFDKVTFQFQNECSISNFK